MNKSIKPENLNIAIYGAGAMGTVLGCLLNMGGLKNVDLITRNQAHVSALNAHGAKIVCSVDGKELTAKVNALLPSEVNKKYDVIFLMTKQRDNERIVSGLLPMMHEDSIICTTQNGLPEEGIARIIGEERTYGAVTSFGANYLEPGRVLLTSALHAMHMEIGGYKSQEKTPLVCEILSYAGKAIDHSAFVSVSKDLTASRWSKLTINAAFSGLSVITGLSFGTLAKRYRSRKITLAVMRECVAVAKAAGHRLAPMHGYDMEKFLSDRNIFKKLIAFVLLPFTMKSHKNISSGMLKDIRQSKRCEIDFINGAVVKAGKKFHVETPFCDQIVEITHGIEDGLYEIDYKNLDFFEI